MSRIAYVDGLYVPHGEAAIAIEDRGFQFSDGVYEVCLVLEGRILDKEAHLARLGRSLAALRIAPPMSDEALRIAMAQMVARNRLRHATLYMQVTRGVARRDHPFPNPAPCPTLVMTMQRFDPQALIMRQDRGVSAISMPDLRWRRCDIKSVSLLGNVLAKQAAREAGAFEAFMTDDQGRITEGASTSVFMVDGSGRLLGRALGPEILPGITRAVLMEIIAAEAIETIETPFTLDEARAARELFLASTTSGITPVTRLDGTAIGDGTPGPLTRRLIACHRRHMTHETGYAFPATSS
ncbi:MAG: D-amino-acid transaminase [Rhodothalassiaceae bacterium]